MGKSATYGQLDDTMLNVIELITALLLLLYAKLQYCSDEKVVHYKSN